ncbi:Golgi SNAP receptor complex member 2 [Thelohanellus kitauei]|uniref:Golgi SNAP receptor complex member 2 n=1 Tax=Thelohanellus kitauei TaxID=669202 RepID=A0A0C2I815_THEKT|nr:Golgi SNAP receptor complex member 2 [Thelohanellus kitauei]
MSDRYLTEANNVLEFINERINYFQSNGMQDYNQQIENEVADNFGRLNQILADIDICIRKEVPQQRQFLNMKKTQLVYDMNYLMSNFEALKKRRKSQLEGQVQKDELVKRRVADHMNVDMDDLYQQKIHTTNTNLDRIMDTGQNILSSLRSQRDFLSNAKYQLSRIGTTLGFSDKIMRKAESIGINDMRLFYLLCFLTIIFIIIVIKIVK